MIHICYGLHDKNGRYSKFTGTSILSMLDNYNTPPSITVHILHDNTLTQDNRDKFIYLMGRYGQIIKFYNVEELCADKIAEFRNLLPSINNSVLSIGTLYRFLSLEILPDTLNKIIYLDSDTIINFDISEMWAIEIGNNALAVVPEAKNGLDPMTHGWDGFDLCLEGLVKPEDYFNAGVLIMNLKRLRNEKDVLKRGMEFRAKRNNTSMDQFILNYCYSSQTLKLPLKYNCFVREKRLLNAMKIENNIYHYLSSSSGLGMTPDLSDSFNRLWFSYFVKTPWFNIDTVGHIYDAVQAIYAERQKFAVQISAVVAARQRAFFTSQYNANSVRSIFLIAKGEEIIFEESEEALQQVIASLKAANGSKIFFLLTNRYFLIRRSLIEAGFVEGRDFINGMNFLSNDNGVPLNLWRLLKAM